MHERVNCLALVSVVVCLLACEGSLPTSGIRPVTSAPPAAQLLNHADASDLKDFHVTYTADLWAEGPLSLLRGPTSVRVTGSGSVVLSPTLSATLHQTSTFCADLCPQH